MFYKMLHNALCCSLLTGKQSSVQSGKDGVKSSEESSSRVFRSIVSGLMIHFLHLPSVQLWQNGVQKYC